MITHRQLAIVLGLFALASIGSGLWRYLNDPAGQNALYFGLVTGGIALVGALLAWFEWMLAGRIVGGLAAIFVLLWFPYDMYKDLKANFVITGTEIRKAVVILFGLAALIAVCLPQKVEEEEKTANKSA